MEEQWDEAAPAADEQWTDESGGHPLAATIIISLIMIVSAVNVRHSPPPSDPAEAMGHMAGTVLGSAIFGLILWNIAFAITIRKASSRWQARSGIAIIIVSTLTGIVSLVTSMPHIDVRAESRESAQQMREVLAANGSPDRPIAPGQGFLSRMNAVLINGVLADSEAYQRETAVSGLNQLLDLDRLTPTSPVLRHCDRIAALAARAAYFRDRIEVHVAAAFAETEDDVREGRLPAAARDGFLSGATDGRAEYQRLWNISRDYAAETASLCNLLARRPWSRSAGTITFNRMSDVERFNRHVSRIQAYSVEHERLRAEARAKAERQISEYD